MALIDLRTMSFRQYRPTGAMGGPLWLHPGQSGTFWWVFDIHPKQATVGAYPVVLRYGLAERCLVCPTIDESMSVLLGQLVPKVVQSASNKV
eukprot:3797514-Amphidinium_carterae.1